MRILSVDDREDNRYLVEAILRGNGYEVVSVANGAEALAGLEQGNFDLILSDILMPVMDGFELCRKVKTDERWSAIPFIVYTATYTGPQDESFALKIGADRFIVKPCEPDILVTAVRDLLDAAGRGLLPSPEETPGEEEVFKLYNERLVRKLEQKMLQLENETASLRETEEALRASEKKYRRLHESMSDGFVFTDMQGNILESNKAYRQMLGYTAEELLQKTYIELTPEKWHDFERHIVKNQILTDDFSEVYEKEYVRKDGAVFPVELRTFLVRNEGGEKEGMWAIVRDISERKRVEKQHRELEKQLQQAQKMESVGRLAGGVAHDYNNMLSVILGHAEMALRKCNSDSELHENLREILDAATRSANITRQLLAFARKQTIAPRVLDLNETVEGMLRMLQRLLGEDVDLVWLPADNLWPVLIDPSQVDQLLANLCVNARDAISDVGKLTIETAKIVLDKDTFTFHPGVEPGEYVVLAVSDNGSGMSQDTLSSVFEPFFTTKDLGKGTGLGLATVYGIVRQNNGFVTVYSELGKGATFKIYLPRISEKACQPEVEKKISIAQGRGETILVVEDEAAILRLTSSILTKAGYRVLTAGNPSLAIAIAREQKTLLHLLITDVVMPEMNGWDLSRLLQSEIPNLKCLFMSGYTANVIAGQGVLDEGMQFIQKPFSAEDLAGKVRQALT